MSITVPRAEIHAIAARYDDAFSLEADPPAEYVRHVAAEYRGAANLYDDEADRAPLLDEADDLDALVDRIEREAAA